MDEEEEQGQDRMRVQFNFEETLPRSPPAPQLEIPIRPGMESWDITALFLFIFGLLKEFKPSEPFLLEYAINDKHYTSDYMIHNVLPYTTYGGLPALLILLFITDFLRYKPVIVFGAVASVASWLIVIFGYDIPPLVEIRQVIESISTCSEVAYLTYMYANVDHKYYKIVTSLNHAALHLGRGLGSLTGQLLLSHASLELHHVNYVTLGGVSLSLVASLFLPPVRRAIYFRSRKSVDLGKGKVDRTKGRVWLRMKKAGVSFWNDMWNAYSNRYLLRWSIWWAIATSLYFQVGLYVEPLWRHIEDETGQTILNGAVDSVQALTSAILGMCVAKLQIPWMKLGEIYLTTISFLQGASLLLMAQAHNLYWNYVGYIMYNVLFQVMIIVVTAEVAEGVNESSEAFMFGLNTVLAIILQLFLTFAVTSWFGFVLDIRVEFLVYGISSFLLGFIFFLIALQSRRKFFELNRRNNQESDTAHELASNMASIKSRRTSTVSIK